MRSVLMVQIDDDDLRGIVDRYSERKENATTLTHPADQRAIWLASP